MKHDPSIEQRASFERIRYANCWEDADVLCEALGPLDGARVLSIASAGDNCFALLAEGAEVVAADLSPAQLALTELKREAIRVLDDQSLYHFLGITRGVDSPPSKYYKDLEKRLSPEAKAYWGRREGLDAINKGLIHAGKFESYFQLFRREVLFWIHRDQRLIELVQEKSREEREAFYESTWNNRRWNLLFRVFFSRFMMGRLGRDPEFFRYVDEPVAVTILKRTRRALVDLPTHCNPYLHYILLGSFFEPHLPRYLRPEVLEKLRPRLDHLTLGQGLIQDVGQAHLGAGYDAYNLSDLFEYLSEELCESLYQQLVEMARPGARLAYWNMMTPRACPESLLDQVSPDQDFADALHEKDLAWFYGAFRVDRVKGEVKVSQA